MLKMLRRGAVGPEAVSPGEGWRPPQDALWLDLLKPTRAEELAVTRGVVT